jgi:hypothetical protein
MFKKVIINNIRRFSHIHTPSPFNDKVNLLSKTNKVENHEVRINNIENIIKSQIETIKSIEIQLRYMQNFNGTMLGLIVIPFFIITYGNFVLDFYKTHEIKATDVPL